MKPLLFLSLLIGLSPCMAADKLTPPNGQQILQIFLQNINKPLKDEPWCQMRFRNHFSGDLGENVRNDDPRLISKTLAEVVAAQIGEDTLYSEDKNFLGPTIDTFCDPEFKEDLNFPDYSEGWICGVNFGTGDRKEPRFTVTSIEIAIKPDLSGIIPGSIMCW